MVSAIRFSLMRRESIHFTEVDGTQEFICSSPLCKAEAAVRSSSSRVRQSGNIGVLPCAIGSLTINTPGRITLL
jgi:hypothetical protein